MRERGKDKLISISTGRPGDVRIIRQKIRRLEAGASPRVLDLFAGCGGFSLGFHASGFDIAAAIECDPDAAQSHGMNFYPKEARYAEPRDITKTSPRKLTRPSTSVRRRRRLTSSSADLLAKHLRASDDLSCVRLRITRRLSAMIRERGFISNTSST